VPVRFIIAAQQLPIRAMSEKSTSEIARETLRALAVRKLQPTPENYAIVFREVSGAVTLAEPAEHGLAAAVAAADWMEEPARRECRRLIQAGEWPRLLRMFAPQQVRTPATRADAPEAALADVFEQIARMVEFAVPAFGEPDSQFALDALVLAEFCRSKAATGTTDGVRGKLSEFSHRLSFLAEDQAAIRGELANTVRLMLNSISDRYGDEPFVQAQVPILLTALEPPFTLRRLDEARRRLKDLNYKLDEIKRRNVAAQDDTKHLIATFIERLSELAELSGSQSARIEKCAKRIETARDLTELAPALEEVISVTRAMAERVVNVRDELQIIQRTAAASAAEVEGLRRELDVLAAASRHDVLTGTLNRKGLDEVLTREIARARRLGNALSIALLDVDNFKALNDVHGHAVGDQALAHLAATAREQLQRQHTISRYGGEEFVVVMSDTTLEEGVKTIERLQRELTRHYFMAGESRILITFSAGVTRMRDDEDPTVAIGRADQGMYHAKRTGKNKVVAT
jgi:diguanylate cyclase